MDSVIEELPTFDENLKRTRNVVHVLGTIILIYMTIGAWYHSSTFALKTPKLIDKSAADIEPCLRYILLLNSVLMCIVFSGFSMTNVFEIMHYYVDNNIKKWYQIDYNDYPASNLYLFLVIIGFMCCHFTINVVRACYEIQRSLLALKNYTFYIAVAHAFVCFVVGIASKCSPMILILTTVIIDYPEHLVLTILYLVRIFKKDQLACRRRNVWGFVAEAAHMISIMPMLIHVLTVPPSEQTSFSLTLAFVIMYLLGFLNIFGWYKLFINTPSNFLVNELADTVKRTEQAVLLSENDDNL